MSETSIRINQRQDPQVNNEYLSEMYHNLLLEEENVKSLFGYMKNQTDMNEKMRAMLIDWIIDVHFKFKLKNINENKRKNNSKNNKNIKAE